MVVKFYNTSSDPRTLSKYLTNELTLDNVQLTDETSIDSPTLKLDLTAAKLNRNYCYIPDFNRYYYVGDIRIVNGNHIETECRCDVLMSFRSDILASTVIAERSSSNFEPYMVDPAVSDSGMVRTYIRKGPAVFNTQTAVNNYVIYLGGK